MELVALIISIIVVALIFYVGFHGLDLRKPTSWLYGILGFLGGLFITLLMSGGIVYSIVAGVVFAFIILIYGATMRWKKLRYEGKAKSLLLQYGKDDDPSLFAKLVRKLLGKYK
jgi:hypothetical protein